MASAGIFGILIELFGLPCGLSACSSDHEHILEAILVQRVSGEPDGKLSFVVRQVLSFTIGALNQDAIESALYENSDEIPREYIICAPVPNEGCAS